MSNPVRLYFDENIHGRLVLPLRSRGFDVLTTVEAGNLGTTDREQLEYAIQTKRTIFTFNLVDFVALHKSWIKEGRSHNGVLVSHQLELKTIIQRILHFLTAIDEKEVQNQLYYLSKWEN